MYMIFPFPLHCRAFLILDADAWAASLGREDVEAGCRGTALAAAGEGGEEGRLPWPWPWPWELVRWKRHLKDPAWVADKIGRAHV